MTKWELPLVVSYSCLSYQMIICIVSNKESGPGGNTFLFTTNLFVQIWSNGGAQIATPALLQFFTFLSFCIIQILSDFAGVDEARGGSEHLIVINDILCC